MKKGTNKNKGFTLVELLATVAIISIVLGIGGYFIFSVINNSQQKSEALALASVKTAARIYVEENPDEVTWLPSTEQSYSCVKVETLISKDLLKKSAANDSNISSDEPKIKRDDYIIITKDSDGNIISETLDTSNTCKATNTILEIPTSKKYCKSNLQYSSNEQVLTNDFSNGIVKFTNNTGTNAGNYVVTASLPEGDGYYWSDGTKEDKQITCTIKKNFPTLNLSSSGIDVGELTGSDLEITLTSNVDGTIKIKTSNKEYATAKVTDGTDTIKANEPKEITIQPLATRDITTIITVTVVPNDNKNYYTGSTTYTIGKLEKKVVEVPNSETYCKDSLYYKNEELVLTENPGEGYIFYNNKATNTGTYTITAKLKFGYVWKNDTNENDVNDKTFQCEIKNPTVKVTYDTNGGTGCDSTTATYSEKYGTLCVPIKDNNMFIGWYTEKDGGTEVTEDTEVMNFNDHTIYAHWKTVGCSISFDGTYGNNGWYKTTGTVSLATIGYDEGDISNINLITSSTPTFEEKNITFASQGNTATAGTTWYGHVKDKNGHVISCSKAIKVDTVKPTVSIKATKKSSGTTVASGTWSTEGLKFTLTKETVGNSGATIYYCKDTTNTCTPGTTIASGTAITSYTGTTGTYYIRYKIVSGAGLSSSVASYTAKVDTKDPVLTMTPGHYNLTNTNLVYTVTWGHSGPGTVTCVNADNNNAEVSSYASIWYLGVNKVYCEAKSPSGRKAEKNATFYMDNTYYPYLPGVDDDCAGCLCIRCTDSRNSADCNSSISNKTVFLNHGGVQYGPYADIQKGCYKITYKGKNLNTSSGFHTEGFDTATNLASTYFDISNYSEKSTVVTFNTYVSAKDNLFEIRLTNYEWSTIEITSINVYTISNGNC